MRIASKTDFNITFQDNLSQHMFSNNLKLLEGENSYTKLPDNQDTTMSDKLTKSLNTNLDKT